MKTVCIIAMLLLVVLQGCGGSGNAVRDSGTVPDPMISRIASELARITGPSWTVTAGADTIRLVTRDELYFYNAINLPLMTEEQLAAYATNSGYKTHYVINVFFAAGWSSNRLVLSTESNRQTGERISKLEKKHGITRDMYHKWELFGRNEDEKKRIFEFKKERDSVSAGLIALPDLVLDGRGIFVSDNNPNWSAEFRPDGSAGTAAVRTLVLEYLRTLADVK